MKTKTKTTLEFDELKDIFRIIELNRDLGVNHHNLKEATQKRNEEMKHILEIGQSLSNLLNKYRTQEIKELMGKDITNEERKSLNNLFLQKHIHLKFHEVKEKQDDK